MLDAEVRAVSLFFYYASLDERKAYELSQAAVTRIDDLLRKNPKANIQQTTVQECTHLWFAYSKRKETRNRQQSRPAIGWKVPPGEAFNQWQQFYKKAPPEEILAVIFFGILKFKIADIAKGTGVSEGTIRLRLTHAFKRLGELSNVRTLHA
ncbi:MAG: hypothetical protein ACLGGX_00115 [Bdellovibrionia bacterium]